jgi:glutathione peroxidase
MTGTHSSRAMLLGLLIPAFAGAAWAAPEAGGEVSPAAGCPPILDRKLLNLQDESISLCDFRGKVLLVVNTASQCGYTPQYEGLEKLYRRYRERGLVVLGFPANDFGGQEPGSNQQIAQFCQVNYGVTFPVFAKTSVLGAAANPLFRDLEAKTGQRPRWNFHKYLVDRSGQPVAAFGSAVEPLDARLTSQIERLLAARP